MEARKPGRSKQEIKKGKASWQPASVTEVTDKEDGYRYRWSLKTPDNLAKKKQEGWETVNGLQADSSVAPENRIDGGAKLTSVNEKHDVVLQRIKEEDAEGRDEYFNDKAARQISGLTAHVKKDLAKEGAETHGEITISTRMGTQTV